MEAVCPDVSQNPASLDTCHVMFLDVATTMLRRFMYFLSVFVFPFLCKCALALPVKGPINLNFNFNFGARGKFEMAKLEALARQRRAVLHQSVEGAGVRGYEAASYLCKVSACEGQELGGS